LSLRSGCSGFKSRIDAQVLIEEYRRQFDEIRYAARMFKSSDAGA
jgi:hypothetical protein